MEKKSAAKRLRSKSGLFPVVGIGASAGGFGAFAGLLENLPEDSGMAFVLIQHLDPAHESKLTELLARSTPMPVIEVKKNLAVKPNRVYVITPNKFLAISGGRLKLTARKKNRAPQMPVDFFLNSLAQDLGKNGVGVILSGNGADGTLGLEAIKAEGGITFAQDDSAQFDSMPRSAEAAGCVDFILSPEEIAIELSRIARHPYLTRRERGTSVKPPAEDDADFPADEDGHFRKILLLLRHHCGVDFFLYKPSTIQRRITRRMVINKLASAKAYVSFLAGNAAELDALYADLLINVTVFFRNPEMFKTLERVVFPRLTARPRDEPVRIWVAGCATGQEAYSIAMSFLKFSKRVPHPVKLQIFATDLNETLLEKARAGFYTKALAQGVPPEFLRQFFTEEKEGWRICKTLRDRVIFARQNLLSDPPFSRLDLISCRNLLIYLDAGSQARIMPMFHYALKPGGFLFLGASETAGSFTDLFEPLDKRHKIYFRKSGPATPLRLHFATGQMEMKKTALPARPLTASDGFQAELNVQREADRVALNRFAQPGVLINSEMQVLQFRGDASAYLKPPPGRASFDVLKMACEGMLLPLHDAIKQAKRKNVPVRKENIRVDQNGRARKINLEVIPLKNLKERCFLIFFEPVQKAGRAPSPGHAEFEAAKIHPAEKTGAVRQHNAQLERELAETRDYLQSTQEQYESANEELQASNEEVTSANEELQSINEELETSKEEMESANEELTTVNEELANRNTELHRLNTDLLNFQTSINVAVVLFGPDLTIRRFSRQAEEVFKLLPTDTNRPLHNIRHNLDFPGLENLIAKVIGAGGMREREIQDKDGRWYLLRVRPYLTLEGKVDGAVLLLVDIDEQKKSRQQFQRAQAIVEAVPPLLLLDEKLTVRHANGVFYDFFHTSPEQTAGRPIYKLGNGQWNIPKLRKLLRNLVRENDFFMDCEIEHDFEVIGRHALLVNARMVEMDDAKNIVLAFFDISDRKHAEEELKRARDAAETASRAKDDFLAALSHELRTPLNPVLLIASDAAKNPGLPPRARTDFDTIRKNVELEARLIDDLLDMTRVSRGKLTLNKDEVDVHAIIHDVILTVMGDFEQKRIVLKTNLKAACRVVFGDAVRLQQIFWNVLKNAVKFTPEGGNIFVESQNAGGKVVVKIRDTGIGMKPDEIKCAFDAFSQGTHAPETVSHRFGGLGLGLAISRMLVESHSGSIRAESGGVNYGATFVIELPLATAAEKKAAKKTGASSKPVSRKISTGKKSDGRIHILLVEDHEPTRTSLTRLLLLRNYKVTPAASLTEARGLARKEKFDLLVSDIGLPDGSGYDLMAELRRQFDLKGIALTGYGMEQDVARSQKSGFAAHLTKPVRMEALDNALNEILSGRSL